MEKKKAKRYCAVFNCLNKDSDPNLTFCRLPKDAERCRQWLTLIDRQDLLEKHVTNMGRYAVCSEHFEDSSFEIIKRLKKNVLPSIFLHNQPHEVSSNSETPSTSSQENASSSSKVQSLSTRMKGKGNMFISSKNKEYATVGTQTESKLQVMEKQTQTSNSLTAGTPRKRKLSNEIRECKLKRRKLEQEVTRIKKVTKTQS